MPMTPGLKAALATALTFAAVAGHALPAHADEPPGRELMQRVDEVVGWLTSTGARVVFLPLAPSAHPSAYGVPSPTNDARMVGLANVLRSYSRQHPGAVSVVDLPALICPQGPPCPAE